MTKREAKINYVTTLVLFLTTLIFSFWMVELSHDVEVLEQRVEQHIVKPVYNAGGLVDVVGKVTGKTLYTNKYTLEIGGYGKFIVSEETWNKTKIGDEMPDEVRMKVRQLESVGG